PHTRPTYLIFPFSSSDHHRALHSFPTRRSSDLHADDGRHESIPREEQGTVPRGAVRVPADIEYIRPPRAQGGHAKGRRVAEAQRSEEQSSELQSRENLVCRLLLEKKKKKK